MLLGDRCALVIVSNQTILVVATLIVGCHLYFFGHGTACQVPHGDYHLLIDQHLRLGRRRRITKLITNAAAAAAFDVG